MEISEASKSVKNLILQICTVKLNKKRFSRKRYSEYVELVGHIFKSKNAAWVGGERSHGALFIWPAGWPSQHACGLYPMFWVPPCINGELNTS